jgi:hypothetical protein
MRHLRLGLLICAVLVWTSTVVGQGTAGAPSTSDPQAVALLQRSLVVLTGGAPVSDATLTGTARRIAGSDDETGTATLKATAAGDSRVDLSFPSGNRSEIRNHSALPLPGSLPPGIPASVAQTAQPVGAWSGPDSAIHGMVNHNIMTDAAWFFPALSLTKLASSPNYILSYVGQETHDGQSVLHLSAVQQFPQPAANSSNASAPPGPPIASIMQHLSQMDLYLDSTTLLPVALAFNVHPDNNAMLDIPTEIRFSGYQAVSGVQAPSRVQKYLNNTLVFDFQFTNVTVNPGLSASAFALQ